MNVEKIGYVYRTDDLSIFKQLDGNRSVEPSREKKIHDSIAKNGYIHCPIIVNENMEVIDGQGRLKAMKELGLPVEYVIFKGLGIKECIALNIHQTGWSLLDYIESYADRNIMSYVFLLRLIKKYKNFPISVCATAVTGLIGTSGKVALSIKSGEFECTAEEYEKADQLLDYAMRFVKPLKNFNKGRLDYMGIAIMFAYQLKEVDREKLVERFERYYGLADIPQFIDIKGALKILTSVYNRRNAKDKIYFEVEYEKLLSGKYTWYAKKWGV